VHIVEVLCAGAVPVCSGGCGVCSLSCAGGIGFHYGPFQQVSATCEKIYTIMAEVTEKSDKRSWVGVLVGVCGYGFWYLRFRWTPSVGMSVST
jgi:hypothetical protein